MRVRSFRAVKANYHVLLELMEELGDTNDKIAPKACGIFHQLCKFETYFCVLLSIELFSYTEGLSRAVQKPSASLSGILESVNQTCLVLQKHATENSMFDLVWTEAEDKATEYGLEPPCVPRKRKVPRKLLGTITEVQTHNSPKEMLRKFYQDSYSRACDEIKRRFDQNGIKNYLAMEKIVLNNCSTKESENTLSLQYLCEKYELSEERLRVNLSTLEYSGKKFDSIKSVVNYLQGLQDETKVLYSELSKLLKILLLFPVSSCTAERGFSVMKFVKSYLRSTMGQERLNHLCLINAYPDEVQKVDVDSIMSQFVNNETRLRVFGKC